MEDITILMGHGMKDNFDKAFKEFVQNDFEYIHPVTGKYITREQFDTLAKEQNWTEEEATNNLLNSYRDRMLWYNNYKHNTNK